MDQGHLIILGGVLLSLALIARGLPPFRRTIVPLGLFCLGMFLLAGFFLWLGLAQARSAAASASWLTTEATVVHSEVTRTPKVGFAIDYVFQVDGEKFSGNTLSFGAIQTTESNLTMLAERFSAGEEIEIYFDPDNPHRNVIWRETSVGAVRAYAIAGILTVFPAILIVSRKRRRKMQLAAGPESSGKQ